MTTSKPGSAHPLLEQVRDELARVADPARAPAMQAYMKSAMPYLGVGAPELRRACRRLFASLDFGGDESVWRETVLSLWRQAGHREERYAAVELTGHKVSRPFQTFQVLDVYEEMIVTGAWWDYVDAIANHRLGPLLEKHPGQMRRRMLQWSRCSDLWKRRSAILCQLSFKGATDLELLYACIEPSLASGEFFLRKAIGWALRQHAWTDPEEVVRYVEKNASRLSPLSKREALKNVLKGGRTSAVP